MRIGIDVSAAVNQRAGIGRYARGVLSAMAAVSTRDWVLEVSPCPNASPLQAEGGRREAEVGRVLPPSALSARSARNPCSTSRAAVASKLVKCERSLIQVAIEFRSIFEGTPNANEHAGKCSHVGLSRRIRV